MRNSAISSTIVVVSNVGDGQLRESNRGAPQQRRGEQQQQQHAQVPQRLREPTALPDRAARVVERQDPRRQAAQRQIGLRRAGHQMRADHDRPRGRGKDPVRDQQSAQPVADDVADGPAAGRLREQVPADEDHRGHGRHEPGDRRPPVGVPGHHPDDRHRPHACRGRGRARARDAAGRGASTRGAGSVRERAETGVICIDATDIGRSRAFGRVSAARGPLPSLGEGEYPPVTTPSPRSAHAAPVSSAPQGVGRDLRFTTRKPRSRSVIFACCQLRRGVVRRHRRAGLGVGGADRPHRGDAGRRSDPSPQAARPVPAPGPHRVGRLGQHGAGLRHRDRHRLQRRGFG